MSSTIGEHPRVSIITRTKDRPALLVRALESIGSQTFDSIQVVVVNDAGEVEPVREAIAQFKRDCPRAEVLLVENETPSGRAGAINDGLAAATAPLYVLHDDDDSWQPVFLERTVAYLDTHPDAVGVATRTWVVYEEEREGRMVEARREVLAAEANSVNLLDTARRNIAPPIALLIRRDAADRVGGYDNTKTAQQDWDFLLRLLMVGSVGFIGGEPLANWHHRTVATGPMSNSVYGDQANHQSFGPIIREKYLRDCEHAELGLVLAMAHFTNQVSERFDAIGEAMSLQQMERAAREQEILDSISELHAAREQRDDEVAELHKRVLGLGSNLEEAHKKLDRIGSSAPRRFLRRVARKLDAPPAPAPTDTEPVARADGPLVIPPAPKLTGSRWLDNEAKGN